MTVSAETLFQERRGRLTAVAYRILGTTTDAEDVVQEAWLRWSDVDADAIADPTAYLVRITTRLAIDRLRSARTRRESYVGPWLPEPILTTSDGAEHDLADHAVLADSVSSAMLLVLEALSPLERAVFVLHEVFDYPHAQIADIVDRSEASVRQTASRGRAKVDEKRRRYDTDRVTRRRATEAFLAACAGGDLGALLAVLAPDVSLTCDGGGLAPAPRKEIRGLDLVARALLTFAGRLPADPRLSIVDVNGGPAVVVSSGRTPAAVIMMYLVDGQIDTIHLVSNPEKLGGLVRL